MAEHGLHHLKHVEPARDLDRTLRASFCGHRRRASPRLSSPTVPGGRLGHGSMRVLDRQATRLPSLAGCTRVLRSRVLVLVRAASARRFRGRFPASGGQVPCHRLAILGALAHGETTIGNFSSAAGLCLDAPLPGGPGGRDPEEREPRRGARPRPRPPRHRCAPGCRKLGVDAANAGGCSGRAAVPRGPTGDGSLRRRALDRVAARCVTWGATVETSAGCAP
jgi:hypothetical protein